MAPNDMPPDPDDMFAETRMTFGEHIEDLRTHLIRAGLGFAIALFVSFFISKYVLQFISEPVSRQLNDFWERHYNREEVKLFKDMDEVPAISIPMRWPRRSMRQFMLAEFPGLKDIAGPQPPLDLLPGIQAVLRKLEVADVVPWHEVSKASFVEIDNVQIPNPRELMVRLQQLNLKIKPPALTTLSVQEAFMVWFKVSLLTGLVLGSPWIFYQIWAFIAAGLYPSEKKYVNVFLPFSLGLFLGGVFLCEFFVMDKAIAALLWFNEWLGLTPDLRLNEWLGFAIFMPLVFGVSFQTPLVMLFIQRVGILTVDTFRDKRRISWFVLAVFAAVITPSVDPISMILLWLPMGLLYELGIWLCVYLPGRPLIDFEDFEGDEQIEV